MNGGVDVKEGIYIAQCTHYLHDVHLFLEDGLDVARYINEEGIVKFEVQHALDRLG